jgi:hypothetical protein
MSGFSGDILWSPLKAIAALVAKVLLYAIGWIVKVAGMILIKVADEILKHA